MIISRRRQEISFTIPKSLIAPERWVRIEKSGYADFSAGGALTTRCSGSLLAWPDLRACSAGKTHSEHNFTTWWFTFLMYMEFVALISSIMCI